MPRNVPLTDEQRAEIQDLRDRFPRMTQEQIGRRFGVTAACINNILTYVHKPTPRAK